jgi:hypothetical protein
VFILTVLFWYAVRIVIDVLYLRVVSVGGWVETEGVLVVCSFLNLRFMEMCCSLTQS